MSSIGNCSKGDPCYKVAKSLLSDDPTEDFMEAELKTNELGDLVGEISK